MSEPKPFEGPFRRGEKIGTTEADRTKARMAELLARVADLEAANGRKAAALRKVPHMTVGREDDKRCFLTEGPVPQSKCYICAALSDAGKGCETCQGRKWISVYDIPPKESNTAASGTTQPCPDCAALEVT